MPAFARPSSQQGVPCRCGGEFDNHFWGMAWTGSGKEQPYDSCAEIKASNRRQVFECLAPKSLQTRGNLSGVYTFSNIYALTAGFKEVMQKVKMLLK
jgi:hypothetical protein